MGFFTHMLIQIPFFFLCLYMHLYFYSYINTGTFFFCNLYTRLYFYSYKRTYFFNLYVCLYFNLYINTGTDFFFLIYTQVYIFIHISIPKKLFYNFYAIAACFQKKRATHSLVHMHGYPARAFDISCNLYIKRCSYNN